IRLADALSDQLVALVSIEKKFWISEDKDFKTLFVKRQSEFNLDLNRLEALLGNAHPSSLLETARHQSRDYFRSFVERVGSNAAPSDQDYTEQRLALTRSLSATLRSIASASDAERDENIRRSSTISAQVIRVTTGLAVLSIAVGLGISFLTTRRIVRPIVLLQQKIRTIAEGRFDTIEGITAPLEIRQLADDFNAMCERLEELDDLKADFVSHVSHELRTPLTAIREASGMLLEGTVDDSPENRAQLMSIVQTECERLIVSVNRILDLSRMEARMMDYQFEKTDLANLVHHAVYRLTPIASTRSITIAVEPEGTIAPVIADEEQILQLLENLMGNALKFTDADGSVTVRIFSPPGNSRYVQVSVTDTGCGIAPENLKRIFDKFHRIETRKGTTRGTGLGLPIAKHIVTAHGGEIWVESQTSRGSTFHFTLPACSG
ncbi:MAG: HAMP domain-containing sensor histidine kinase, partial [Desulfobacterales bacterium]